MIRRRRFCLKISKLPTVNTESVTELDKVFDVVEDDVYGDTVIIKVTERSSVLQALKTSDFKVIADMEAINEVGAIRSSGRVQQSVCYTG